MATAASNTNSHNDMQAYSVLENVHKSDQPHELATTISCAERASCHEADRYYYRNNHPERLAAHTITAIQPILRTAVAGLPRAAVAALRRAR